MILLNKREALCACRFWLFSFELVGKDDSDRRISPSYWITEFGTGNRPYSTAFFLPIAARGHSSGSWSADVSKMPSLIVRGEANLQISNSNWRPRCLSFLKRTEFRVLHGTCCCERGFFDPTKFFFGSQPFAFGDNGVESSGWDRGRDGPKYDLSPQV